MELGLSGRPALVAAASRGLGKACALALAAEGAKVAICARDRGALEAARDEIAEATGATVVAVPSDVATEEGAVGFVRQGAEAVGGCDVLVANAGGPPTRAAREVTDDDLRAALEENLFSTVRMAREAIPRMRESGYGRIVVIGSSTMRQPVPGLVLSTAVRSAMAGWARHLADEVALDGITVNVVLPGRFLTDRVRTLQADRAERAGKPVEDVAREDLRAIPVGRLGEPRELGDLVAFLASERAGYLTGSFIQADGGLYRGLY